MADFSTTKLRFIVSLNLREGHVKNPVVIKEDRLFGLILIIDIIHKQCRSEIRTHDGWLRSATSVLTRPPTTQSHLQADFFNHEAQISWQGNFLPRIKKQVDSSLQKKIET